MTSLFVILQRRDPQGYSAPLWGTSDPQIVRRVIEVICEEIRAAYEEHEINWKVAKLLSNMPDSEEEGGEP